MKRTSPGAFTLADGAARLPLELALAPGESAIGWYRNPPPWEHDLIVFTSEAIYLVTDDKVERVLLNDIVDYESPKSKENVQGLRVRTKDGFRFIRIAGSFGPNGNRKDAFSLGMVLLTLVRANYRARTGPQ